MSDVVNNEQSWKSSSKAIWMNSGGNNWLIGSRDNIGTNVAGVYASRISGHGPDSEEVMWNYRDNGWKKDTAKDIEVKCINDQGKKLQLWEGRESCEDSKAEVFSRLREVTNAEVLR